MLLVYFAASLARCFRVFLCIGLSILISACGGSGGGGAPASTPPPSIPTSTVSGTITVAPGAIVDGDVNDPIAIYTPNDTYLTAQPLPNPVTLGGYLNVAGTGYSGDSFISGDPADFYSIGLVEGQTITLVMAENPLTTVDLDLYLLNAAGDTVDFSDSTTSAVETLTVPSTGNYFIMVDAFGGYSNYTLRVGVDITQAKAHTPGRLALSDAFVPGEMIVKFRDEVIGTSVAASSASRASSMGLQLKAGNDTRRAMLMSLGDKQSRQATFNALGIPAVNQQRFKFKSEKDQLKHDTLMAIKALRKRADVLYAEPNYIRTASAVSTDPLYSSQWHYPLINLPAAWDNETGDPGVTVAIIDTGVLMSHPDLQGQFSTDGGYDFISSDLNSGDGQPGIDNNPDDAGDSGGVGSSSFHGTHVAGTVAAATTFSPAPGVRGGAGVAPGVKLMPVRVLGQFGGAGYDIMQGVRYAAGLSNDSGVTLNASQRADVINLSLGGGGYSQFEQDIYTQVRAAGVVVVAAAGNDNSSALFYPASYVGVISVSSVDRNKQKAYYSNSGTAVDVAAPGGDSRFDADGDGFRDGVLSTHGDDSGAALNYTYNAMQGTSMASPHMAGVVALMKSAYSGLTPQDVDSLLSSGAIVEDIGTAGRDDFFGYGLIDANKAVIEAIDIANGGAPPPSSPALLVVSPSGLNLGDSATTALLDIRNGGSDPLTNVVPSENASWLMVTNETVDANGLGSYRVTIDKSSLALGVYQADITFNSSVNSVVVSVTMQVVAQAINGDAGYQYVLLIDAADFSVLDQWSGNVQGGSYLYQFDDVPFPAGRQYYVIGGTDINNDWNICDPGEACGAYFSLSNLSVIDAAGPHTGLDFVSGFDSGIGANASVLVKEDGVMLKRKQSQSDLKGVLRNK